jgi:hypothetical protein
MCVKMMNKRGAVFHWIIFGILIALAIILSSSKTGFVTTELKGQWPIDFMRVNYFEAQKENFKVTITAKEVGKITAIELGQNGGFASGDISDCGKHQGKNLWNKQGQFCYPDIEDNFSKEAKKQFDKKGVKITMVNFSGTDFIGIGEEHIIDNAAGKYTYKDSFIINIDYDFSEYDYIFQQASSLLAECRGKPDLSICLQLPANWYVGKCKQSEAITERKVAFCVLGSERLKVEHHFALDFTS